MNFFKELVEKFNRAEQQLEAYLVANIDPSEKVLKRLDKKLTAMFDELFQARLLNANDHLDRAKFMVDRISKVPTDSQLAKRMLDQIELDLVEIRTALPNPELKLVAKTSGAFDSGANLVELCYASRATSAMTPEALSELREQAISFNQNNDITGLLTYDEKTQQFIQLLEGLEDTIRALMDRIIRDPRHYDVVVRFQSPIEKRLYRRWAMGLITTSQVRRGISSGESVSTWVEEFLGLGVDPHRSRGHQWMTSSITSLVA